MCSDSVSQNFGLLFNIVNCHGYQLVHMNVVSYGKFCHRSQSTHFTRQRMAMHNVVVIMIVYALDKMVFLNLKMTLHHKL